MTAWECLFKAKTGGRGESEGDGGRELILNESTLAGYVCGGLEAGDPVKLITARFLLALHL